MTTDCSATPAEQAESRRSWTSPTVHDLGSMRHLTLLQGVSIGGECNPDENPDCGFG
jgi:hypothetical protein